MTSKNNMIHNYMHGNFKRTASCKNEFLFYNIKNECFKTIYENYKEAPILFLSKRKQTLYRSEIINSLNTFMIQGGRRLNTKVKDLVITVHID